MSETQTLYAVYRYELRHHIAHACNDLILVTPDSGNTTTFVDAELPEADDYYNKWDWACYVGTHIDITRKIVDWVLSTHTATVAAVTGNIDTTDLSELHRKFTTAKYNDAINRAIRKAQRFFKYANVDETLHMMGYKKGAQGRYMRREYDIPAGFDYINDVWIESTQRYALIDCDSTWSAIDTDVTQAVDDDDFQEGGGCIAFTVGAGISDGDIIAYNDFATAKDLSMYKKISFWIYVSSAVAASDLALRLDNTSGCGSPLETIVLPAIAAKTWTFVESTLANPESDTSILSVGLEYNANKKANTIKVDDIRAVLDGQPRFDCPLDRKAWSIIRATTPQLKLHQIVGITPGKAIRIEGWKHQDTITSDASTCAVPPDFIIQQALAYLFQEKPEYSDSMKIAQSLAEEEKKNIKIFVTPGSKAVHEK